MRRLIVLLLITGTVWAQTDFDKLVLDDGTETLGEYLRANKDIVYFKPTGALAYQVVPISRIRSLQLKDGKTIINNVKNEKLKNIIIGFVFVVPFLVFTVLSSENSDSDEEDSKRLSTGEDEKLKYVNENSKDIRLIF